jgi:hypothetical protein
MLRQGPSVVFRLQSSRLTMQADSWAMTLTSVAQIHLMLAETVATLLFIRISSLIVLFFPSLVEFFVVPSSKVAPFP